MGKEASTEPDDNWSVESQRKTTCLQMLRLFNSPINTAANCCASFTAPEKNILNIPTALPGASFSKTLSGPLVQVSRGGRALFSGLASLFTEGCYFGTNVHCYHQLSTGFVRVKM